MTNGPSTIPVLEVPAPTPPALGKLPRGLRRRYAAVRQTLMQTEQARRTLETIAADRATEIAEITEEFEVSQSALKESQASLAEALNDRGASAEIESLYARIDELQTLVDEARNGYEAASGEVGKLGTEKANLAQKVAARDATIRSLLHTIARGREGDEKRTQRLHDLVAEDEMRGVRLDAALRSNETLLADLDNKNRIITALTAIGHRMVARIDEQAKEAGKHHGGPYYRRALKAAERGETVKVGESTTGKVDE